MPLGDDFDSAVDQRDEPAVTRNRSRDQHSGRPPMVLAQRTTLIAWLRYACDASSEAPGGSQAGAMPCARWRERRFG